MPRPTNMICCDSLKLTYKFLRLGDASCWTLDISWPIFRDDLQDVEIQEKADQARHLRNQARTAAYCA